MVEGRNREKKWSNALRNGGSAAMRIPMDASADDQTAKFIPSHVGSCVVVSVFSSTVLKTEQTAALHADISIVYRFSTEDSKRRGDLRYG